MDKLEVNIGLFGCTSVGKTTLLKTIFGKEHTDTETIGTDMLPAISYHSDSILGLDKTKLSDRIKIKIYDIPGICNPKKVLFEWIEQNMMMFDIIILMTDLDHGLTQDIEVEMAHLLMSSINKYHNRVICLINKCDQIYFDKTQDDLVFKNKEQENIYLQANHELGKIAQKENIKNDECYFTPFLPVSAKNSFTHRFEEDKQKSLDSGYPMVKSIIQNMIYQNQSTFMVNHIKYILNQLSVSDMEHVSSYTKLTTKFANLIMLSRTFYPEQDTSRYLSIFWERMIQTINYYIEGARKINVKLDNQHFESYHSNLLVYNMNLLMLIDTIKLIPGFPQEIIKTKQKELFSFMLNLYDSLCYSKQSNNIIHPQNILQYLQIIQTYQREQLGIYCLKFLKSISQMEFSHLVKEENDLYKLITFMVKDIEYDMDSYLFLIGNLLTNKMDYLQTNNREQYLPYLIKMKGILRELIPKLESHLQYIYHLLYEIIKKRIMTYLPARINLYEDRIFKQAQNYNIINIDFEIHILNAFIKSN